MDSNAPQFGVYSNTQIKAAVANGHIVAHPYIEDNVNGSSYDVTLGHWFYSVRRKSDIGIYNPFDQHAVSSYFDGPHHSIVHEIWCEKNGRKLFTGIPADHPIIVLQPGERILAHTHEFIGIKPPGTTTMQARSTWGRNGVAVCLDAGWGAPGYINRWTLEIYNMNEHESVVLPVGERIAQLVFYHTGPVEGEYNSLSGKYQTNPQADLRALIRDWRPEQMLPQAYRDKRIKPQEV